MVRKGMRVDKLSIDSIYVYLFFCLNDNTAGYLYWEIFGLLCEFRPNINPAIFRWRSFAEYELWHSGYGGSQSVSLNVWVAVSLKWGAAACGKRKQSQEHTHCEILEDLVESKSATITPFSCLDYSRNWSKRMKMLTNCRWHS